MSPRFNRLWFATFAAQGAEQLALTALPLMAALALGAGAGEMGLLGAAQTLRQAELDRARAEVDAQEARVRWLHLRGELLARYGERLPE